MKRKENPEKVIIIPRPPRANNQEWVPLNPDAPVAQEDGDEAEPHADPIVPIDPGCNPMNNQVEGPAQGLAGVPSSDEAEDE